MQVHQSELSTTSQSCTFRPAGERQLERSVGAQGILSAQQDFVGRVAAGVDHASPAKTGVSPAMFKVATGSAQARDYLLHLQRRYGNRHVQRVLAMARQDEGGAEVAPEIQAAIEHARGGGHALDNKVRTQMESAFGADFSTVRVHTGSDAHSLNQALSARAFATGQDIFFRHGEYNPGSSSGRELLAHELTHVVQQNGAGVGRKLTVGQPDDIYEQEAERVAREIMQSERENVGRVTAEDEEEEQVVAASADSSLQRQPEEEEEQLLQPKSIGSLSENRFVQRICSECERERRGQVGTNSVAEHPADPSAQRWTDARGSC